jgi:hypothetical protein
MFRNSTVFYTSFLESWRTFAKTTNLFLYFKVSKFKLKKNTPHGTNAIRVMPLSKRYMWKDNIMRLKVECAMIIVAPLYVATPLNVAFTAKCRTIAAKCRNRR